MDDGSRIKLTISIDEKEVCCNQIKKFLYFILSS